MKISTKGRYALSFMMDLLINSKDNPIRLKDISQRQDISEKYLEQIAILLVKGGIIGSIRGSNGGYFLKRDAQDYTVGEILRIMEGDLAVAPCMEKNAVLCKRKNILCKYNTLGKN